MSMNELDEKINQGLYGAWEGEYPGQTRDFVVSGTRAWTPR